MRERELNKYHRQIILLVSMVLQGIDNGLGHREGRLSEAEIEYSPPIPTYLLHGLVDGQGC